MARCRFVQPDTVRLKLADVHRRAHDELVKDGVKEDGKFRPANALEVAASAARVANADADGAWIEVKKELNAGEQRRVLSRLVKTMHFNEKAVVDPEQVGFSNVVEFLVGWSLVDAQGKSVPVSEAAIGNLDGDTYAEIVKAIDTHEAAVDAAREQAKNAQGDESKSNLTSSSAG